MARLIVVTTPDLSPGYRLAGTATETVRSPAEAAGVVAELVASGEGGVIAVHEPFLARMDPRVRRRFEDSVDPVVVALPEGGGARGIGGRRARLTALLQHAVGYRLGFGGDEP
jgi:vacuolar-type H+-ATPase subunit F/Vma7